MPLSYSQEQVWLHAQLVPDIPLYNEPVTIHYSGDLDVPALEASFNEILRRHEAWRTCFTVVDGEPVAGCEARTLDLAARLSICGNFPKTNASRPLSSIATLDAVTPLDLTQAPLFRARLIRMEEQQYRLYLVLSHIIFDGVAIYRVFLPELAALYRARVEGRPSPLPELDSSVSGLQLLATKIAHARCTRVDTSSTGGSKLGTIFRYSICRPTTLVPRSRHFAAACIPSL